MSSLPTVLHMGAAGGMVGLILFGLSTMLPAAIQTKLARAMDKPFRLAVAFAGLIASYYLGDFFVPLP